MGTENEYGSPIDSSGVPLGKMGDMPIALPNGGEFYIDLGHIEYASPETSNAVAATAYHHAGMAIAARLELSEPMYCNNVDGAEATFGAHESYFTKLPPTRFRPLIPFLIARTVMTGNGSVLPDGSYEISQRARFIRKTYGLHTTQNEERSILNLRHENMADVAGWHRLHLICGDANMSEVATFLKLGTTSLMIELLECAAFPEDLRYDRGRAIEDLHSVSRNQRSWPLQGMQRGPADALGLLFLCLERAEKVFAGRDSITDALLIVWRDTLDKLDTDPELLAGRLDWVKKRSLIELYKRDDPECTVAAEQSLDMEYHSFAMRDAEGGLYFFERDNGRMERLVSDAMISYASEMPPYDTRAYIRGRLAAYLDTAKNGALKLSGDNWEKLTVGRKGHPGLYARGRLSHILMERPIKDPFCTYETEWRSIIADLADKELAELRSAS